MERRGGAWACCPAAFDDEDEGIPHTKDRCMRVDMFATAHRIEGMRTQPIKKGEDE